MAESEDGDHRSRSSAKSKKTIDINDFKTRADKLKDFENLVPETTISSVIIRPNEMALGFRYDCYSEEILGHLVSKETFTETVRAASRICETGWIRKRTEESLDFNLTLKRILYVSVLLIVLAFVLLGVVVYWKVSNIYLFSTGVLLIVVAALLTLFLIITSFFKDPVFTIMDQFIQTELKKLFEKENQRPIYKANGLKWSIGKDFYWLELHILSR